MDIAPFLLPLSQQYPVTAQLIGRQPGIPVSTNKAEVIRNLEPIHRGEIEALGFPWKKLRRAQQIHGNAVALVGDIGSNYPVEGVDGLICSGVADCIMGIYVADCAAIWLYDKATQSRALLHSGKQGTELNIVRTAIKSMKKILQTNPADLVAVISPCIRPPEYEVDIARAINEQLRAEGVLAANITDCGINTATNLHDYYSYRTEQGTTGRMLALFGGLPHTH